MQTEVLNLPVLPSNNIYAEIFKESPSISDNNNNVLTVSRLHFLFTQAGTLKVSAQYTANGVTDNSKISVSIAEDQGSILHNLSYDGNGNISADVSRIITGQYEATITVKAGRYICSIPPAYHPKYTLPVTRT